MPFDEPEYAIGSSGVASGMKPRWFDSWKMVSEAADEQKYQFMVWSQTMALALSVRSVSSRMSFQVCIF